MDLGLKGKIALITGAGSGIGLETARELLNEGATVILNGKTADKLKKAAESLENESRVFYYTADNTDVQAVKEMHEKITRDVGKINILVPAAGITGEQGLFHEVSDEGWVHTLETNLMGAVRVTKEFLPDLRSGGWGRIVYIASEDAVQPYEDEIPYCSAKAGILALMKGLSRSYTNDGLLVNAVSPAFIKTPMTEAMMEKRADQLDVSKEDAIHSFLKDKRPFIEFDRRGKTQEVAAVIAFLCSERASFVNGANYRVDGGSVASI